MILFHGNTDLVTYVAREILFTSEKAVFEEAAKEWGEDTPISDLITYMQFGTIPFYVTHYCRRALQNEM